MIKKPFHVTITDNVSGTVELDTDTDCIIGAVHQEQDGKGGTICLGYTDCSGMILAATAFGAIKVSKQIMSKPGISAMLMAMLAAEALGEKKEEENNEMDSKREDEGVVIPFPSPRSDK